MAERRVTLTTGETFGVRDGELILDAALRQGVAVAHSCRNGTCRTCLFQVQAGDVRQEDRDVCMITEQELEAGRRLLCMSTLHADAVLEKVPPRRRKAASE